MSARRRRQPESLDTCKFLAEQINPAFDPNKVLLRRVSFINDEKGKYVSVGFYPAKTTNLSWNSEAPKYYSSLSQTNI
jgi:hypothetical protein